MFAIVCLKTLQQQLRTICEDSQDNKEIDRKLNIYILKQNQIIDYVKMFDDLVAYCNLAELLLFGLLLIALLFLLNNVRITFF